MNSKQPWHLSEEYTEKKNTGSELLRKRTWLLNSRLKKSTYYRYFVDDDEGRCCRASVSYLQINREKLEKYTHTHTQYESFTSTGTTRTAARTSRSWLSSPGTTRLSAGTSRSWLCSSGATSRTVWKKERNCYVWSLFIYLYHAVTAFPS